MQAHGCRGVEMLVELRNVGDEGGREEQEGEAAQRQKWRLT